MFTRILLSLSLIGASTLLHAQASPTASRAGDLQIGGGFSTAASDYGKRFNGVNAYADFDFREHIGIEANFHFVQAGNGNPLYEKTYEIGGRYLRHYGPAAPYVKALVGRGVFNFPACPLPASQSVACANLAYNIFALGAGTDVHVRPWLNVRGDFEYQNWPSFPPTGLTPLVVSIGAAYHFH